MKKLAAKLLSVAYFNHRSNEKWSLDEKEIKLSTHYFFNFG